MLIYIKELEPTYQIGGRNDGKKFRVALYRCEYCNKEKIYKVKIVQGGQNSCGCQRGKNRKRTYAPLKNTWRQMITRCYNKNNQDYKDYGGRGILVCDEWKKSYQKFYEDIGDPPVKGHTLDRIDNDKGYYKENCKWSIPKEQANNRRNTIYVEYKNEKKTLSAWAEQLNMSYHTLNHRIKDLGWSVENALTIPVSRKN